MSNSVVMALFSEMHDSDLYAPTVDLVKTLF